MLELRGVCTRYGPVQVLWEVSLTVGEGELVCLLGGNASGKSTTMKTILGLVHPVRGEVLFRGRPIHRDTPAQVVRAGIAPVLESRRIFPQLTVYENLLMGAYTRTDGPGIRQDIEAVYERFPLLRERRGQLGGTLSGGEQQMLAIARALLARPRLLVMDEPSMGLSPLFVEKTFEVIQDLNRQGIAILLVEQNANMALAIAHRGYVLQTGRIVLADTAQNLVNHPMMRKAYLEL
ncbi:MAG: ABC transporter ATP-binding protein [candidate division NC10 bacterium]|nr:ABC transporter ATP-binding protein [candidate division NC10 bacterium]MBI2116882.1 ABC transporter ATP-binding protein [candidate division NC10 bacterium]MBI2457809.1 ABC transporter ATP-binding protein [candidate division NC10 bacterium]